jgi:protein-S-isoprenylcysteine O-methyltransferase Ste14
MNSIKKTLYGFLFVVVVPAALWAWAHRSDTFVHLPVPESAALGIAFTIFGVLVMTSGMDAILRYGDGLPMNAFPPAHYVTRGVYRYIPHPIYAGFSLACIGLSIIFRSPSGLWLISPVVILCCVALVYGYENPDLVRRFGSDLKKPLCSLPSNEMSSPSYAERVSVYFLVLLPWVILYEAVAALGIPKDAVVAYLPFESNLPVVEWTEIFYGSTYLFVILVPLVVRSSRGLREFSISGLAATGLIMFLFIAIPFIAPPREFIPQTFLGTLLIWERMADTPAAAFPSFHVVWAFLAARAYAGSFPALRIIFWLMACAISLSCIATGMHAAADVVAGFLAYLAVVRLRIIWEKLRAASERIANSWKEWRIGPVRIINHGMYPGLGMFIGLSMIGSFLGPAYIPYMLLVAFSGLILAGLWAQYIEGSPSLLRPYGYYGGVIGVFVGSFIAYFLGADLWLLLGAYAVAAPWIQALGRLRCLVQGCCHGRQAPLAVGIRYVHPRSRVCRLSGLAHVPIHPTPLYSILWNAVTEIILARLWFLYASPALIGGLYLILNGIGRFVEESYRGEPQTPMLGKLRLYQWLAIVSITGGAFMTTLDSASVIPVPRFDWSSIFAAAGFGLATWFALGVDFPDSNKRFSRLV